MPTLPHRIRPFGPAKRSAIASSTQKTEHDEKEIEPSKTEDDAPVGDSDTGRSDDGKVDGNESENGSEAGKQSIAASIGSKSSNPPKDIGVLPGQSVRLMLPNHDDEPLMPPKEHPQIRVRKFWNNFEPEFEGGVTQILPELVGTKKTTQPSVDVAKNAFRSYEQARDQCIKSVERIARECRALNQKYTDAHFDLERDLKITRDRDCLVGLIDDENSRKLAPQDVKRVTEIFKDPQFYEHGASYDDIIQGQLGDCWFLAALSALTVNEQLVRNVCVKQEQEVGVYGFVFYRDGEWQPCIIDDKLYLRAPSYEESNETVLARYNVEQKDEEQKYRELFQTGSKALYFASCRHQSETWVPLIEKAYAKMHGDYYAINGGQTGEAIEDLTGGVVSELYTTNLLSKDRLWNDGLKHNGKEFLFSIARAWFKFWRGPPRNDEQMENLEKRKEGIEDGHAYSLVNTYEGHGERLCLVRNPWGDTEWNGPWSDGSKEWTAEWLQRLNHKFGNDGVFWISYNQMLQKYKHLERTRLFGPEWHVVQRWTSVQVPWNTRDYQQTKFTITVPEDTEEEAVIVLSQLDKRYFKGLEGRYKYTLQFRVQKDDDEEDYVRSQACYSHFRSTNVEMFLEKGTYTVLFKVEAEDVLKDDVETVIRENYWRKAKLTQIATLYDLAHSKARPANTEMVDGVTNDDGDDHSNKAKGDEGVVVVVINDSINKNDQKVQEGQTGEVMPKVNSIIQNTKNPNTNTSINTSINTNNKNKNKNKNKKIQNPDVHKRTSPSSSSSPPPSHCTSDSEGDDNIIEFEERQKKPANRALPDPSDPDRQPWNAWTTVGLRVYTKIPDLELKVVLASNDRKINLDRDDIARAALDEAEAALDQREELVRSDGDGDGVGEQVDVSGKSRKKMIARGKKLSGRSG